MRKANLVWTWFRDQIKSKSLHISGVLATYHVKCFRECVHSCKIITAESKHKTAEHCEVLLLGDRRILAGIVHQNVCNTARANMNSARRHKMNQIRDERTHLFLPVTMILVASTMRTARPASCTTLMALAIWMMYDHKVASGNAAEKVERRPC